MADAHEAEALRDAQAFRPNSRPMLIAVAANVLVAGLLLGVPYVRGHARAEETLHLFARFAGCLLDGKPQPEPGLALPAGERAHFAAQVMRAPLDWPGRCRKALHAIAPEEAIFLWPSVKQTGADVSAAVALLDRELLALARARQIGASARVPTRPLLALAKLRGMLTLYARAGDADTSLDRDAVAFGAAADVIDPSRLPLSAAASAALEVWPGNDGWHALALDGSGLSFLHLEGGKVARGRVRRTGLLRGALRDGERSLLVFAMPEARCAEQETRCVKRATGFAYLDEDVAGLPTPSWVSGHPAGRPDRSVQPSLGLHVDLLARASAEGALEVRRFALSAQPPPRIEGEQPPPLPALARFPVPATAPPRDALLLSGPARAVLYATPAEGGAEAWLWAYDDPASAPIALGTAQGEGGFVEACEAGGTRWFAFGTQAELAVVRSAADAAAPDAALPATKLALAPLAREESRRDRVRVLCSAEQASVLVLAADQTLSLLRCDARACTHSEIARAVTTFDAALTGEQLVIAHTRTGQPQLVLARVDARGALLGKPSTPAPCWDPEGGMCGQATLVAAPERLLLGAREGADLLALESTDGGQHWTPLRSLELHKSAPSDASAPMQQHRLRKGLE